MGMVMADERILLVDDDPVSIRVLSRVLSGYPNLQFATNGADALRLAADTAPDLILLDAEMPDMSGFQVCEALKRDPLLSEVAVIFVTSHSEPEFEVAGLELGAVDFISKPVSAPLVLARVRTQLRLKNMADELRYLSMIDALTGTGNRRAFDANLQAEWRRSLRNAKPLALLMVDVDHFKAFNDRYGHPAGDTCLKRVAAALQSAMLRPADKVARIGGEEFAVLLPETDGPGAERVANRLLGAVEALAISHGGSLVARHVTVSIGVSSVSRESAGWNVAPAESRFGGRQIGKAGHTTSPLVGDSAGDSAAADLLLAADRALYAAKLAGRARAHVLSVDAMRADDDARDIVVESP